MKATAAWTKTPHYAFAFPPEPDPRNPTPGTRPRNPTPEPELTFHPRFACHHR